MTLGHAVFLAWLCGALSQAATRLEAARLPTVLLNPCAKCWPEFRLHMYGTMVFAAVCWPLSLAALVSRKLRNTQGDFLAQLIRARAFEGRCFACQKENKPEV